MITTDEENMRALRILNSMFDQKYANGTFEADYIEYLVNEIMRYESIRYKENEYWITA